MELEGRAPLESSTVNIDTVPNSPVQLPVQPRGVGVTKLQRHESFLCEDLIANPDEPSAHISSASNKGSGDQSPLVPSPYSEHRGASPPSIPTSASSSSSSLAQDVFRFSPHGPAFNPLHHKVSMKRRFQVPSADDIPNNEAITTMATLPWYDDLDIDHPVTGVVWTVSLIQG